MSTTTLPESAAAKGPVAESSGAAWSSDAPPSDFSYAPVSPLGPVALVLGIASLTAFTNSILGIGLAIVATLVGIAALLRLWSTRTVFRGLGFAAAGAALSAGSLVFGSMKLKHAYENECPPGYQRVSFPNDISEYQFVYYGGQRRLHPSVAPYIGQKVFLKGYMWGTLDAKRLNRFVFLKDNGECCFGGDPKPYDMMEVRLGTDEDGNPRTVPAYRGMIAVAGVLHANVAAGEQEPVYTVEADIVEEAQTSF